MAKVPARYASSSYVTGLAESEGRAKKRARDAKAEIASPMRIAKDGLIGATGGAIAGGIDDVAESAGVKAPVSLLPSTLSIGLGIGMGSPALQALGWGGVIGVAYAGGKAGTQKLRAKFKRS